MATYTFQNIMTGIIAKTITTTTDVQIYITRQAYVSIITASNGNIPAINLPLLSVSIIDFSVGLYNYVPCAFPFVATDFTTATDWVTYVPVY